MQDIALVPAYSHTATPATKRDLWLHKSSSQGEVFLLGVLSGGDGDRGMAGRASSYSTKVGHFLLSRLISFDGNQVTFRWRDYAHVNKKTQNDSLSRSVHPAVLVD